MKTVVINTFIAFLCLYLMNSQADVSGKAIAYACYSCHGEKLNNLKKTLSAQQLNKTLLGFKKNEIENTIMGRITKGYSDNELKSVARYIGELK